MKSNPTKTFTNTKKYCFVCGQQRVCIIGKEPVTITMPKGYSLSHSADYNFFTPKIHPYEQVRMPRNTHLRRIRTVRTHVLFYKLTPMLWPQ